MSKGDILDITKVDGGFYEVTIGRVRYYKHSCATAVFMDHLDKSGKFDHAVGSARTLKEFINVVKEQI